MSGQTYDVGPVAAFDGAAMHPIEVEGEKFLLVREGQAWRAIGALCPHAGAPLAEGILDGHRIICPWHKATFCIRTGALLEPPAVDPLPRMDVQIAHGRVILTRPAPSAAAEPAEDPRCFVIVGGGAAGAMAAQTLREEGFNGRIVMLDRENRVPYDRTLLSKYFLSGEPGAEKSPLQSQAFYRDHSIERRTAEVTCVDPLQRRIICADGIVLEYDGALLATGAAPPTPTLPNANLPGVFTLRSRADAEAILAKAEQSQRVVILGASFIGMEVAASLRERGLDVTVVCQEHLPFEKQLGAVVAPVFTALHRRHGVQFRLNAGVAALEGEAAVRGVRLKDGEQLAADMVVIGFGVRPVTGLVDGVALAEDGGVPVDAQLHVINGLFAAGDIARFPHRGDGEPIRVEHWRVAEQHGRVAARNMLGQALTFDAVPVFWTIQYLKRLDYVGHATSWDDVVVHGDCEKAEFIAYYVKASRVIAAVGMDRDQDMAALVALFTRRRDWTAAALGAQPSALLNA